MPEGESIVFIQVSPCGQRAFVSLTSSWFVWDISSDTTIAERGHSNSKHSVVVPDWKCVALIENGTLVIVDLMNEVEPRRKELDTDATGTQCEIQVTPDGRRIIVAGIKGVSVWRISKGAFTRAFHVPGATAPIISPDAKFLVCFRGQAAEIYDLDTGRKQLSQPCLNLPTHWDRSWMASDGTIIGALDTGENQLQLTLRNFPEVGQCLEPIVTPTRVFYYDSDTAALRNAVENGPRLRGQDDPNLTAVCLHCGKRLVVPESAKEAIYEIIRSTELSPNESPCLHLPDEAWNNNSALRIQCEHCAGPLRLNPFVA